MENIENHYTPNDSIHLDENLDKDLLDLKEFSKIENKLKKSTSSQNSPTQNLFLLPLKKNFSQIPINFPNYLSLEILSILIKKNILDMNLDQQRIDKILENLKNTNPEYASNSPNILMNQILNNYFQELERINDPIDQIIIEIPKNDVELKEIPNKKEIEIQIEEILPNSIQCWICYNYYVKNDQSTIFFQNHDICNSCLINYIEEKIKNNSVLQIKCPDNCGVILTESDIELILKENENLLKKYKYFKNLSLLDLDPDLRWCIKPSCSALIKGCQENGKGICSKCKTEICFKCRGAWHGRKTCEKALDEEFKQYKKTQIIKFCKKCKSRMEKNGGCNHMTCQVCKYQFCWICDRVYEPNHYDKNNIFGCPGMQYSDITGISLKNICLRGYVRLLKVLKILLIILGILLLPIIYILIAIITPGYIYISYRSEHQKKTRKQNLLLAIISIIVGIFLLPLSLILLICPGSCLILKEYRKRKLEGL